MVRRRPTPPPTVKGANYGDGSNFLRSAVPDSLRFSTKLSLDKATGRLVSKVASARHRAKGVDDDGQRVARVCFSSLRSHVRARAQVLALFD